MYEHVSFFLDLFLLLSWYIYWIFVHSTNIRYYLLNRYMALYWNYQFLSSFWYIWDLPMWLYVHLVSPFDHCIIFLHIPSIPCPTFYLLIALLIGYVGELLFFAFPTWTFSRTSFWKVSKSFLAYIPQSRIAKS